MLNWSSYNYKTDIWSLGTISYEILTGQSPFKDAKNKDQLRNKMWKNSVHIPSNVSLSKECLRFINLCLTYKPEDRPGWEELIDHHFIRLPKQEPLFGLS